MSDQTKKIIYIVAFVLITVLLGFLLYFLFLRQAPTVITPNANEIITVNGLPTANINTGKPTYINVNGKLIPAENINTAAPAATSEVAKGGFTQVQKINEDTVVSPTMSADGKALYAYNPYDGKFYRYNTDGSKTALSDKVFKGVENISWSPDKNKVIMKFADNSTVYLNFGTQEQISLPKQWEEFDFSSDSTKIAFKSMGVDRENRWIAVANENGSGVKHITSVGDNTKNIYINWSPDQQIVGNYTESIDMERQYLMFIGQNNENFPSTIVEGRGYQGKWSPDGEFLFYSVYSQDSDLKPTLWTVTGKGSDMASYRVNLELNTWADKCTFADKRTVYCAVPQNLPTGAGLMPEIANSTPDDFYKIDIYTNTKSLVAIPSGLYTATDLQVSDDGNYLYFKDNISGTINQIKLK
ncbi:MAG: hypothetical protein WC310_00865 [Patescibacteria group bacterium]|jgi:dipeptidyl aminopeptidase/acylaminoacyl peptidase